MTYIHFTTMLLFAWTLLSYSVNAADQQVLGRDVRPNIVFILTDDQDLHMDSLSYMPFLQKHITNQGTTFLRHYCTVALCCPSRTSLWTGRAAHNTNVTDVNPPHGGYPKFVSQGFNEAYLPIWMQNAGYNTYYVGKLFNAQTIDNYDSPHAAGWTGSDFLLGPGTYEYMNATMQRNHDKPVHYTGLYSTDVVAEKAYGFLEDAVEAQKPFFLTIAPAAPHSNVHINRNVNGDFSGDATVQSPPVSAGRHQHLFDDVVVPRTPHFNPARPHSVNWIASLPRQNDTNIAYNDEWYRKRLRALQAVDELVDGIVTQLHDAGILDNTYIFYSTDNGYHIGQHRLQPGKQTAFEEDVHIPLLVRGPGVSHGRQTAIVTTHTDLAPTFLSIAGVEPRADFDGSTIPITALELSMAERDSARTEHVNIEMWGIIMSEGSHGAVLFPNHTYKALRVIGERYDYLYTVWCNNVHELYDLTSDPFATTNLFGTGDHGTSNDFWEGLANSSVPGLDLRFGSNLTNVAARLDALLMVLKTCRGHDCIRPWEVLHPDGSVQSLTAAMDPQFDQFYTLQQQRIRFEHCETTIIPGSEGPTEVTPWVVDEHWSDWT